MTLSEQFLQSINDPTIAYLLLSAGLFGIFFEIVSPGAIVPGVAGGIAILFGITSLGNLDANWAGLMLMGLAFLLFIIDLHAPSHGVLTFGGIASFALGSFMLENSSETATASISRVAVLAVTTIMAAFFLFAVGAVLRTRLTRSITGKEGMRGAMGDVREPIDPEGYVFVMGELWRARSTNGPIPAGEEIRVVEVDGLTVIVEPVTDRPSETGDEPSRHDTRPNPINSITAERLG
jgi:membrane-bound serine protease (ClpP class)